MAVKLPSGTVTFLFTDVEGSTWLLDELGPEAYAVALADHRRVIREIVAREGGVEVDTQGDAFFFSFPTAPAALSAARGVIDALATGPIRVRIGVHTGTPLLTEEGYIGADVHRAARIAAAGHGGQVLVSAATAALVGRDGLHNLGEHRFKDLAAAERVWQLGDGEFPPLKSLYQTNLPVPGTPFLGREREVAAVVELLTRDDVRLLTLTGPGGTGKTRLALRAGADTAEHFPGGRWWISFAALRDPALAISAVAEVLGVRAMPGRSLREMLADALAGRRCLLLLDNAEHLLPGIAVEIAGVRTAGGATLLVTSRERLQLQGENVYDVPALTGPDALALFLARASALNRSPMPTAAVVDLCERLDRLPLAIELAAARTRLFSPEQLLERLGQRLDLLKGGRDADPRQQTLRATIQWSHDLLGPDEQALFQGLAVFAGGCTYAAGEAICGADPDTLQSLVDKSLVRRRDHAAGEPRFWMLETIREYAAERLASSGLNEELGRAHAGWYAARAAWLSWPARFGEEAATNALAAEVANIRVALANALGRRDARVAGNCLFGLWHYWLAHGLDREATDAVRAWLALDRNELTPLERMPGLLACGEVLRYTGDLELATAIKQEQLVIARAHPGESVHGREMRHLIAATLGDLAQIELAAGNLTTARASAQEAVTIRRRLGEPFGIGHALIVRGTVALVEGDLQRARGWFAKSVEALAGSSYDHSEATLLLAECELLLGDAKVAAQRLAACADRLREVRDVYGIANLARVAGMLALERGDPQTGAALTSAFGAIVENAGVALAHDAHWQRSYETVMESLRASLAADIFNRACHRGAGLSEDEVLELAADVASGQTLA